MYPLKFRPIYKEKIWGDRALADKFARELPSDSIGESWEVAAHKKGNSKIINGRLAGKTLIEVVVEEGTRILGSTAKEEYFEKFPLLVKLIDANDKLSVQVHPDDAYAAKNEAGESGKAEMWYVIEAEEEAKLILGVRDGVNKDSFAKAIQEGRLAEELVEVEVEAGDAFYIPAGTVHSIQEGVLLAEIQQNADLTYRVYDWDRLGQDGKPRELHIEAALEVINFERSTSPKIEGLKIKQEDYQLNILVACPFFVVESIDLKGIYREELNGTNFYILMVVAGEANLTYQGGELDLEAGETVLLPAELGKYQLEGDCKLIRSYIKDLDEFKLELKSQGYSQVEIARIAGVGCVC